MNYQTIILEKKEGIATITLNRPEKLNAQTPLMYQELSDAYRIVDEDEETRVLVITGAGRAFSAGADVSETLYKERIQKREEQGVPDVIRGVGLFSGRCQETGDRFHQRLRHRHQALL